VSLWRGADSSPAGDGDGDGRGRRRQSERLLAYLLTFLIGFSLFLFSAHPLVGLGVLLVCAVVIYVDSWCMNRDG